jgi:hypothetical protein
MKLRLFKAQGCPELDQQTLALLAKFLSFVIKQLKLEDQEVKIRLLGACPNEPITTGAYSPSDKTISTIAAGRHLIDYCRTIAHELTHMKQDVDGRIKGPQQEIGGQIEDEANAMSGRFVKHFIKNILTAEDKKRLGLGSYGA